MQDNAKGDKFIDEFWWVAMAADWADKNHPAARICSIVCSRLEYR
jgi:hypothetical protein